MRSKFSRDEYAELYGRVMHKLNNMRLLTESERIKGNRRLVWKKQRAKDVLKVLEDIMEDMPKPTPRLGCETERIIYETIWKIGKLKSKKINEILREIMFERKKILNGVK